MTASSPHPYPTPRILVVDDDASQRSLLQSFLTGQGFQVVTAGSGESAILELSQSRFAMMISDVRMPGISGLDTLRSARRDHPSLPILLVTAYADVRDAVDAMRDGALNYLSKPIDLDELLSLVRDATGLSKQPSLWVPDDLQLPKSLVAESAVMRSLLRDTALVAPSDSRVLLTGESGVGKEVLADLIHAWSRRAGGPLVKINCAALPETLLESELFGHAKGAFTGASSPRIGRFEQAGAGTIFLDEITEMSPQLQAKLLRVTQSGHFQKLGSNQEHQTNARILAASNRVLEEEVAQGRFREDLYYRLNVVELHIPPLRERLEDILPLAKHFIEEFSQGRAKLSAKVMDCLTRYPWPGNIRELRNAIERAALLSRGEVILPDHLPTRIQSALAAHPPEPGRLPSPVTVGGPLEDMERDAILQSLKTHGYNRTETAKALGISRRAMLYKLRKLRELGYPVDSP